MARSRSATSRPEAAPPGDGEEGLVSIVIPALNEASYLGRTMDSVAIQTGPLEVLVVDGGSSDGTVDVVRNHGCPDLTLLHAPRGRGVQMNAGAAQARGQTLIFLHADTQLPAGALDQVRLALEDSSTIAGAFRLQFDERSPLLNLYALCSRIPWRFICFGDRAPFVRKSVFEAIGGFPEVPLFEDLELVRRVGEAGRFRFLSHAVVTSARRFSRHGRLRQQLRNARLWTHYLLNTDPARIAHLYHYD